MAAGRRGLLTGLLAGVLPFAATAAVPVLLVPVQYRQGRPPRHRRRRCWMQREQVWVQDRYGLPHLEWVMRQVCH